AVHRELVRLAESACAAVGLAVYLLPSAVTAVCRRSAWRHWWRFVVLFALNLVVEPGVALMAFFVAETWVLHRSWVVESDPADRTLIPRPLRGLRRTGPARAHRAGLRSGTPFRVAGLAE